MIQPDIGAIVAEFDLLHSDQTVTIVASHVTDITAAVNELPRCQVRMINGKKIHLGHPAAEVTRRLFPARI